MNDDSKLLGFSSPDNYVTRESRKNAKEALLKFFRSRFKEMKEIMKLQNDRALENKRYEFLSLFGKINNLIAEFEEVGNQLNADFPRTPQDEYCSEEIEQCLRIDTDLKESLESIHKYLQKLALAPDVNEVSYLLNKIREETEKSENIIQERLSNFNKIEETHKQCEASIRKINDELQRRTLSEERYTDALKFLDRFPDPVYPAVQVMEILNERINIMLRTVQTKANYDPSIHRFFKLCEKMLEMLDARRDLARLSDTQTEIMEKFILSREKVVEGLNAITALLDAEKQARARAQTTKKKKKKSPLLFIIAFAVLIIIAIIITIIKG